MRGVVGSSDRWVSGSTTVHAKVSCVCSCRGVSSTSYMRSKRRTVAFKTNEAGWRKGLFDSLSCHAHEKAPQYTSGYRQVRTAAQITVVTSLDSLSAGTENPLPDCTGGWATQLRVWLEAYGM